MQWIWKFFYTIQPWLTGNMKPETNPPVTHPLIILCRFSNKRICTKFNNGDVISKCFYESRKSRSHGSRARPGHFSLLLPAPISAASPDSEGEKIIREIVLKTTPVRFSVCRPVFWNFNWLQTMSRNRPLTRHQESHWHRDQHLLTPMSYPNMFL